MQNLHRIRFEFGSFGSCKQGAPSDNAGVILRSTWRSRRCDSPTKILWAAVELTEEVRAALVCLGGRGCWPGRGVRAAAREDG